MTLDGVTADAEVSRFIDQKFARDPRAFATSTFASLFRDVGVGQTRLESDMLMYYGSADEASPDSIATIIATWQRGTYGKTNLDQISVPFASHHGTFLTAVAGQLGWFNAKRGLPDAVTDLTATPIDGKLAFRASIQCDIELTDVRVSESAMLPGARGLSGPFGCLNEARFGIVFGVMGAARACLDAAIVRSTTREVFGKPIGSFQLTQAKLADLMLEYEKGLLLALHLGRLKEKGDLTFAQISIGKLNNVREAIKIAGTARSILGGDGITNEFPVMRHMANLEAVRTYEGTDEVHALVVGREMTGLNAFV
jgi:hypothetical protein